MISQEKLLESVNLHIAKLIAEEVTTQINAELNDRWNTILSELAYTRKTSEQLKEALVKSQQQNLSLEQLLNVKENQINQIQKLNIKSAKILEDALNMLGAE